MASPTDFIENLEITQLAPSSDHDKKKTETSCSRLVGGSVLSFTDNVKDEDKQDLCEAFLIAQLGANKHVPITGHGDKDQISLEQKWFKFYYTTLEHVGFLSVADLGDHDFQEYKAKAEYITMDDMALDVLQQSSGEVEALKKTLQDLKKVADEKGNSVFTLFEKLCTNGDHYNFQVNTCEVTSGGDIVYAVGAFYLHSEEKAKDTDFFFSKYKTHHTKVYYTVARGVFNKNQYARVHDVVRQKLGRHSTDYINDL